MMVDVVCGHDNYFDDLHTSFKELDEALNAYLIQQQILDRAVVNVMAMNHVIREIFKLFAADGRTGKGIVASLVKQEFKRLQQEPFMELQIS